MLLYWIWFAQLQKVSDQMKWTLLQHFQDPEEIYYAESGAFADVEGLSRDALNQLRQKDLTEAEKILRQCQEKGLKILTIRDAAYPAKLKNISDPPMVLYYKGELPDFDGSPVIGVVGTRKASAYGLKTARKLGYQIARCGGIVVSGMAHGIDGMAMDGALTAEKTTVGVLGCGADMIYPLSNRKLFRDVERYGCILSEFPPETPAYKWNFPRRNRIISGLSNGVLIVEAPARSGALITADRALEQGRDVFVIPGNVDMEGFAGSNRLLREGATFVSCGWDILSEYQAFYPDKVRNDAEPVPQSGLVKAEEKVAPKVAQKPKRPEKKPDGPGRNDKKAIDKDTSQAYSDVNDVLSRLNRDEQAVVCALQNGERLVDDVIAETGLNTGKVLATLTLLEVKGVVKRLPGRHITLK